MNKIHYAIPSLGDQEADWVKRAALIHGDCSTMYVEYFQALFAEYVGSKYAVATSSCTGALHLGLAALGIGPGDEVILADTNWIATAAPIVYLGAKPVFVDILEDTWCIDPSKLKKAITKKTKAIIATHLYGNLCDMNSLVPAAGGIPIIEDAAEALGSDYMRAPAGSMGRFGVYSFHGSKTMTTQEGGMLVTDDKKLANKVRQLNNHGRSPKAKQFCPEIIGYKYKMTDMQASMGVVQLTRFHALLARKRQIFTLYECLLDGLDIKMNPRQYGCFSSYWMPTVVTKKKGTRKKFVEAFGKENIDARVFFYPLSSLKMFEKADNPVAYDICRRAINLPSYNDMTDKDQLRVAEVVKKVVEE